MKKIIIAAIIVFSVNFAKAQNNLVFNEVKLITLSVITAVTVPDGKVWKIEHVDCQGNADCTLMLNDVDYKVQTINTSSIGPLWLPAGTTIKRMNISSSYYAIRRISVLEFNVVPL
jgi:hypothetical protein